MKEVSFEDVKKAVQESMKQFKDRDRLLINVNSSERSMTHALAVHLKQSPIFEKWHIDCEYNRDVDDVKKLKKIEQINSFSSANPDDLQARTIYPDIIIHCRRQQGEDSNLLVIEAKKNDGDIEDDKIKVQKILTQFKYRFGLVLKFPESAKDCEDYFWYERESNGNIKELN